MGTVYRVEDELLGSVVAIKFLSQSLLNARMRDRFLLEAKTCAQLSQKSIHIVRVSDYGVDDEDTPYYVMEYLHGDSLSELIRAKPIPLLRFLNFARQICLGLQSAHQGIRIKDELCPIIHRDIKPSNILVIQNTSSLGELVKVLDFGIVKLLQSDAGQTSSYMGTLAYSSPEQMEGRELDARSDIYSLGVMMFEMLTGKMPLQAETHSFGGWYKTHHFQPPRTFDAANPGLRLPKALENLVMSCLEKSAAKRPQSVAEILKALQPLEERYEIPNRKPINDIDEILRRKSPILEPPTRPLQPAEPDVRQITWPKSKPIAQIVFPQILTAGQQKTSALWTMLPREEIQTFQSYRFYNKIYQNFLCIMSPHPMLLWLTAIYNSRYSQNGPRWLRCYLDLKTPQGQEMTRLLSEQEKYPVLLFFLEEPKRSPHEITVSINKAQCAMLQNWAITSQTQVSVGAPTVSKDLLQKEFDTLKLRVATEMEKSTMTPSPDVSR